jgi:hypothetical protein
VSAQLERTGTPIPAGERTTTVDVSQPVDAADAVSSLSYAVRVEWFAPDRPVNGTVFVRPERRAEDAAVSSLE